MNADTVGMIQLPARDPYGQLVDENLLVERITLTRLRLICSPALLTDLVADDEIELTNETRNGYELVSQSGNVSVRLIFHPTSEPLIDRVLERVHAVDGWLDGKVMFGQQTLVVYTIPQANHDQVQGILHFLSTLPGVVLYPPERTR